MSTRPRRVIATACILAATFTLATASTSTASSEVPDDIEVLFSRGWVNAPGNWDGTPAPAGVLQVDFGFRVDNPTLTMHEKGYPEFPGVHVSATPTGGAVPHQPELHCYVTGPAYLTSITPDHADVQCYGAVQPADADAVGGNYTVTVPGNYGSRTFTVPWQPITWPVP